MVECLALLMEMSPLGAMDVGKFWAEGVVLGRESFSPWICFFLENERSQEDFLMRPRVIMETDQDLEKRLSVVDIDLAAAY